MKHHLNIKLFPYIFGEYKDLYSTPNVENFKIKTIYLLSTENLS